MTSGNDKSLESWIWDAACSIRGAKDAAKYKEFILPLIFTKRLDALTYFVQCKLAGDGIADPETASRKARVAFAKFPNWRRSEAELREVRKEVTFAILAKEDDIEKATATVEALFTFLQKSFRA